MAKGIPFLKDAPYNVLTVPNYVRNLVVTTAPGTIKAQYNPPDDPEATECWTTYKAGSYPEHPFDGKRVVTPLEAPGVVDGNTRLLLHMNDMADSSPMPKEVSSQGEVTFEDISGAYGGRAAHFSGTSYLTLDRSDDWAFPGDFTVDFRVYPLAWGGTTTNYNSLFVGTQSGGLVISREPSGSFGVSQYGSTAFLTCAIPPLNQWTHVAVCRSGTTVRVFYNGVLQAQAESSLSFAAQPIGIGGDGVGSYYNGYIDELRVSNTARWTADFEPPLAAYGSREPVSVTMTEGVENETQYGVRVFIRGRLGFQTRKGGAQAMVTPVAGQPASAFPAGTPLAIPMTDGSVQKRIVVHQGNPSPGVYPDSCNGVWTWEAGYGEIRQWSSKLNDYANSSGNAYLNSDYLNKFAPLFRDRIKTVKIPYRPGSGESMTINSGENGLEVRCFYLSGMEVGWPAGADALPICGAKLDYFDAGEGPDSKRAKSEYWWLRDPFCSSSTLYAWAVYRDGSLHNAMDCSTGKLSLPACIIPSDMLFSLTPNPDGSYSPIL